MTQRVAKLLTYIEADPGHRNKVITNRGEKQALFYLKNTSFHLLVRGLVGINAGQTQKLWATRDIWIYVNDLQSELTL